MADEFKRIKIKSGAGLPTIPVSADHRNGDWLATDIYESEFYQDTNTGLVYTRNGTTITSADGSPAQDIYKAILSQTGTGDPVIEVEMQNTLGLTVVPTYIVDGSYQLAGFDGNAARVVEITLSDLNVDESFESNPSADNLIMLRTYLSGVLADDVLVYEPSSYPRRFNILTIRFY